MWEGDRLNGALSDSLSLRLKLELRDLRPCESFMLLVSPQSECSREWEWWPCEYGEGYMFRVGEEEEPGSGAVFDLALRLLRLSGVRVRDLALTFVVGKDSVEGDR